MLFEPIQGSNPTKVGNGEQIFRDSSYHSSSHTVTKFAIL